MEDIEILSLWKDYDKRLHESLVLNKKNAEEITKMKIFSNISSMKPIKLFTIIIGITWIVFVDTLIINVFPFASPFFLFSAVIQVLLTKIAALIYFYQLVIIYQLDINHPVLQTQEKLARLIASTIWLPRLLFLQLPLWTIFYWNKSMLENGNMILYIIQGITTISFTIIAIWLFLNINYKNKDKTWFKLIFNGNEWSPVTKSMELLKEIKEYEY